MAGWRKPPIFAFAYISPARSSKRRMSIIVPSHSRATSGSGSTLTGILSAGYLVRPALRSGPGASLNAPEEHVRPEPLARDVRLGKLLVGHPERRLPGAAGRPIRPRPGP